MIDWPNSLREINALPEADKYAIYGTLLPDWLFSRYQVDPKTLAVDGEQVVSFRCPKGSRALEITVKRYAHDRDPMLYFNMVDTFNNQLLVLLVIVNDPDSPRYNTELDEHGNSTQLGTSGRNVKAELHAMRDGLAPGQIRRGLRSFKLSVPRFEEFVAHMGHDLFLIEPLAYHNAIIFERYGFSYMRGHQEMVRINREFTEGGELFGKLDSVRPFRQQAFAQTIRGRSWAIHDGILGHPFTGFQMYKRIGHHAGVNTFPDGEW